MRKIAISLCIFLVISTGTFVSGAGNDVVKHMNLAILRAEQSRNTAWQVCKHYRGSIVWEMYQFYVNQQHLVKLDTESVDRIIKNKKGNSVKKKDIIVACERNFDLSTAIFYGLLRKKLNYYIHINLSNNTIAQDCTATIDIVDGRIRELQKLAKSVYECETNECSIKIERESFEIQDKIADEFESLIDKISNIVRKGKWPTAMVEDLAPYKWTNDALKVAERCIEDSVKNPP